MNALTNSVPLTYTTNFTIIDDESAFKAYCDNGSMTAQQIAEQIFQNYCVMGVYVRIRYIKESWTGGAWQNFYAYFEGEVYAIGIWAIDDFCQKDNPTTPPLQL